MAKLTQSRRAKKAPRGITVTAIANQNVITFEASSDTRHAYYQVGRFADATAARSGKIYTLVENKTTKLKATDSTPAALTTYAYAVRSVDTDGNPGRWSEPAIVETRKIITADVGTQQITPSVTFPRDGSNLVHDPEMLELANYEAVGLTLQQIGTPDLGSANGSRFAMFAERPSGSTDILLQTGVTIPVIGGRWYNIRSKTKQTPSAGDLYSLIEWWSVDNDGVPATLISTTLNLEQATVPSQWTIQRQVKAPSGAQVARLGVKLDISGSGSVIMYWFDPEVKNVEIPSVGDVGTYAFMKNNSGALITPNTTTDGANLVYSDTSLSSGASPASGSTWQCHGRCPNGQATLFSRIS